MGGSVGGCGAAAGDYDAQRQGDWAAAGGASRFGFWVCSCWRQLLSCRLPVNVTPELTPQFTANLPIFSDAAAHVSLIGP
jgi:hypothetical protein